MARIDCDCSCNVYAGDCDRLQCPKLLFESRAGPAVPLDTESDVVYPSGELSLHSPKHCGKLGDGVWSPLFILAAVFGEIFDVKVNYLAYK